MPVLTSQGAILLVVNGKQFTPNLLGSVLPANGKEASCHFANTHKERPDGHAHTEPGRNIHVACSPLPSGTPSMPLRCVEDAGHLFKSILLKLRLQTRLRTSFQPVCLKRKLDMLRAMQLQSPFLTQPVPNPEAQKYEENTLNLPRPFQEVLHLNFWNGGSFVLKAFHEMNLQSK